VGPAGRGLPLQPPLGLRSELFRLFQTATSASVEQQRPPGHGTGGQGEESSHSPPGKAARESLQGKIHPVSARGELEGQAQLVLSLDLGRISLPAA